jgi:extracellular factor (EF) 3-hydroxypalmitic acid methyl ester biosynthesis protein
MFRDITVDAVEDFMVLIEEQREDLRTGDWKTYISKNKAINQWRFFLSHDPYTRWGLIKPRGYAGDATLMDFAYKHPSIESHIENAGAIGQAIYNHTSAAKQSKSARDRVKFIADQIATICRNHRDISICSIAAGHGREVELLSQSERANIRELLAIDSDIASLNQINEAFGGGARCVPKNAFRVRLKDYGSYDLVYSLGLFDYLEERYAISLIDKMWCGVKPGGRLLIANLNMNAANLGYCEAIMDWWMIQRNDEELMRLGENLQDSGDIDNIRLEHIGCFSYLLIDKR